MREKQNTPEAKYDKQKSEMDQAIAHNDIDDINRLTASVLPPEGSDNPVKRSD
jgi:hypothetical protein